MGKQEYLSAGRFAALVGTTKETLFHYDEIGLFVPKRRGTNGYRYYAMDQMETFDVIGMLRELGMPLAEIRNYLEQRSPEKFGVLLEQEEKVVTAAFTSPWRTLPPVPPWPLTDTRP